MNKLARDILLNELDHFREKSYKELVNQIGNGPYLEVSQTTEGKQFHIEIEVFWDDHKGGNVRVFGMIEGEGIKRYKPQVECFIINKKGLHW